VAERIIQRPAGETRVVGWHVVGSCAVAGVVALLVALFVGGGRPLPSPPGIPDSGAFVGWVQVVLSWLVTSTTVATIGALLYAVVLSPRRDGALAGSSARAVRFTSIAAAVMTSAALLNILFTYCYVFAFRLSGAQSAQVWAYATQTDLGRVGLATTLIAAVVLVGSLLVRTLTGAAWVFVISLVAVVPPALSGHAAGQANHDLAMMSLLAHILAVTLWVGGLLALVVFPRRATDSFAIAAGRYSAIALVCFVATAVSGVGNAALRFSSFGQLLGTGYGALVLAKTASLLVLGWFGWRHRRYTLREIANKRRGAFVQMATGELVVMAMAVALGVALSRTPTPEEPFRNWSTAENLVGHALPPFTAMRWLTAWRPDLFVLLCVALAAGLYINGIVRLHRARVHWPPGRTISWLLGLAFLTYAMCGAPMFYATAMFSAHMVMHMMLTMLVPIVLALGAPITLALRAIPARPHGSPDRGVREWILILLHSRAARAITNPIFAFTLYVGTLYAFYFSPMFTYAMGSHTAHMLMHLHFLLVGTLYFWPIIGIDPMPRKLPYIGRIALLFASMPFHAFFGVEVMGSDTIIGGAWFRRLNIPWVNLASDQRLGGGIAWSFSEAPSLVLIIVIAIGWWRSDTRDARRFDRSEDRTGDAQLAAYNDWLASLGGAGPRAGGPAAQVRGPHSTPPGAPARGEQASQDRSTRH
jgi:cytochrome c oxidase assembly factor CtaG/putative copper export protein